MNALIQFIIHHNARKIHCSERYLDQYILVCSENAHIRKFSKNNGHYF